MRCNRGNRSLHPNIGLQGSKCSERRVSDLTGICAQRTESSAQPPDETIFARELGVLTQSGDVVAARTLEAVS